MVTGATYGNRPFFQDERRLTFLRDTLLKLAADRGWMLQAWAVMPNHHHFIAQSPTEPTNLTSLIRGLHSATALRVNAEEQAARRRVWFQYWDSRITFEKSYFARLKYVHLNPVKHGLVDNAEKYRWCFAAWFAREAHPSVLQTVMSFPIDRLNVMEVECGRPR